MAKTPCCSVQVSWIDQIEKCPDGTPMTPEELCTLIFENCPGGSGGVTCEFVQGCITCEYINSCVVDRFLTLVQCDVNGIATFTIANGSPVVANFSKFFPKNNLTILGNIPAPGTNRNTFFCVDAVGSPCGYLENYFRTSAGIDKKIGTDYGFPRPRAHFCSVLEDFDGDGVPDQIRVHDNSSSATLLDSIITTTFHVFLSDGTRIPAFGAVTVPVGSEATLSLDCQQVKKSPIRVQFAAVACSGLTDTTCEYLTNPGNCCPAKYTLESSGEEPPYDWTLVGASNQDIWNPAFSPPVALGSFNFEEPQDATDRLVLVNAIANVLADNCADLGSGSIICTELTTFGVVGNSVGNFATYQICPCFAELNQPPLKPSPLGTMNFETGEGVNIPIVFNDPDGDVVTCTDPGNTLPPGLSLTGCTITGTISAGAETGSPYAVSILGSDGRGGFETCDFTINVVAPAPLLARDDGPYMPATAGTEMYDVGVNDDDFGVGATLTEHGSSTHTGVASFDALTGVMTYTPGASEPGTTVMVTYEWCNSGATICDTAVATIEIPPCPAPALSFAKPTVDGGTVDDFSVCTHFDCIFVEFAVTGTTDPEDYRLQISPAGTGTWVTSQSAERVLDSQAGRVAGFFKNGLCGTILPGTDYDVRLIPTAAIGGPCELQLSVMKTVTTREEPVLPAKIRIVTVSDESQFNSAMATAQVGDDIQINVAQLNFTTSPTSLTTPDVCVRSIVGGTTLNGCTSGPWSFIPSAGNPGVFQTTSIPTPGTLHDLWSDDRLLVPYNTVTTLNGRTSGWASDGTIVYVKLPGGVDPNTTVVCVGETNQIFHLNGAHRAWIEDIKFQGSSRQIGSVPASGVLWEDSTDVIFTECEFTKLHQGLLQTGDCSRGVVQDSYFHENLSLWGIHGLKNTAANPTGTASRTSEHISVFNNNDSSPVQQSLILRRNLVDWTPNGPFFVHTGTTDRRQHCYEWTNNTFQRTVDPSEFDAQIINGAIWFNVIHGSASLSMAPFIRGPAWVEQNQFTLGWRPDDDNWTVGGVVTNGKWNKEFIHHSASFGTQLGSIIVRNNTIKWSTAQVLGAGLTAQNGSYIGMSILQAVLNHQNTKIENNIFEMDNPGNAGWLWFYDQGQPDGLDKIKREGNIYNLDINSDNAVYRINNGNMDAATFETTFGSNEETNFIIGDPLLNAQHLPTALAAGAAQPRTGMACLPDVGTTVPYVVPGAIP